MCVCVSVCTCLSVCGGKETGHNEMREASQMTTSFWRWTSDFETQNVWFTYLWCAYMCECVCLGHKQTLVWVFHLWFFLRCQLIAAWLLLRIPWWFFWWGGEKKNPKLLLQQNEYPGATPFQVRFIVCNAALSRVRYLVLRQHRDHFELPCEVNRLCECWRGGSQYTRVAAPAGTFGKLPAPP